MRGATSLWTLVVLVAAAALALTGCTGTCEDSCRDDYDDCMARSPPGAERAACSDAYSRCLESCGAQR